MNKANVKTVEKSSSRTNEKKVVMLNISQFELTKILYSSGILAKCDLTPSAKLFLWALCSHYNPNNKTMFPSQQTVAQKLGISEKSAQRAVKELKTHGLIDYETKRVNHYVFGEKFFEMVKMSGMIGQNVLSEEGQNVLLTNKKEKKKEQGGFSFKNGEMNFGTNNGFRGQYSRKIQQQNQNTPNRRVPNSEETKKIIEEHNEIRAKSVSLYELGENEALEWLKATPIFWRKKSKVAKFLIEKYGFEEL